MWDGEQNAVIESVSIDDADRGFLTAWLHLRHKSGSQSFGGYGLYLPEDYKHHSISSPAGHFIWRCMEIGGVTKWSNLPGKCIRVRIEDGLIKSIGHIIEDKWFTPKEELKE